MVKKLSMVKKPSILLVFAIVFSILFCAYGIVRLEKAYRFDSECTQYLRRAAEANFIEFAKVDLGKAISYAESHDLTEGNVSIFLNQPQNDLGYWYNNTKMAYAELEELSDVSTTFERSYALMRLRKILTSQNEDRVEIIVPDGISIYPYNRLYFLWGILSFVFAFISAFLYIIFKEESKH